MQQGSPLLLDAGIVRAQQRQQIAFGLVRNHLDDVGQVLAFGSELDHGPPVKVTDFDTLGKFLALRGELRHASAGGAQLFAELAMGDLEAAHGRAALFGIGSPAAALVIPESASCASALSSKAPTCLRIAFSVTPSRCAIVQILCG